MTNNFSMLYTQFKDIVDKGTEQDAEKFLTDHMDEFPEEMKQGVIMALFEKGITEVATNQTAVQDFKQESVDTVHELEEGKRILDDKLKVLELEAKM